MDRIKDSGSFDWGSTPHRITNNPTKARVCTCSLCPFLIVETTNHPNGVINIGWNLMLLQPIAVYLKMWWQDKRTSPLSYHFCRIVLVDNLCAKELSVETIYIAYFVVFMVPCGTSVCVDTINPDLIVFWAWTIFVDASMWILNQKHKDNNPVDKWNYIVCNIEDAQSWWYAVITYGWKKIDVVYHIVYCAYTHWHPPPPTATSCVVKSTKGGGNGRYEQHNCCQTTGEQGQDTVPQTEPPVFWAACAPGKCGIFLEADSQSIGETNFFCIVYWHRRALLCIEHCCYFGYLHGWKPVWHSFIPNIRLWRESISEEFV